MAFSVGSLRTSRAALARAITLVESTRPDHRRQAQSLLASVLASSPSFPNNAKRKDSFRIGLSGSPGVGKSSFIETFGMFLIEKGHKVAVLAVDPSSARTGGSILGDKTRMTELSRNDNAYVRPSPSRGTLGGVARNTSDAILLCEAAGYDIVLVETVGVGQSETMVADMVDLFTLLVAPGGGDELQGMKKGIVELSDLILVNKSDGVLEVPARMAQMEYTSALKFVQPSKGTWKPEVLRVSSAEKRGIEEAWTCMETFYNTLRESGDFDKMRAEQRRKWMWDILRHELMERVAADAGVKEIAEEMEHEVMEGNITSGMAAEKLLSTFFKGLK
ncbi:LAO/AO transport system ATPase [Obelidium mucronatum]|nr:LAO/AO transport system ATPase [Obelidium mucronatum]